MAQSGQSCDIPERGTDLSFEMVGSRVPWGLGTEVGVCFEASVCSGDTDLCQET